MLFCITMKNYFIENEILLLNQNFYDREHRERDNYIKF